MGRKKTVGNRDIRRSVKGERWGVVHGVNKMDTTGTFRRKAGNLKEVGLGWINGGRKDNGFGWGKIRDVGEQVF